VPVLNRTFADSRDGWTAKNRARLLNGSARTFGNRPSRRRRRTTTRTPRHKPAGFHGGEVDAPVRNREGNFLLLFLRAGSEKERKRGKESDWRTTTMINNAETRRNRPRLPAAAPPSPYYDLGSRRNIPLSRPTDRRKPRPSRFPRQARLTRPSEPILIPKLRIEFADFPYLH